MVEYGPDLDDVFRALGDATRRRILGRLTSRHRTITELAAPFEMSLAAVSKHVSVLERAGLVRRTVEGRVHRIALDAHPLRHAATWLETYRRFWEAGLDALADMLEEDGDG